MFEEIAAFSVAECHPVYLVPCAKCGQVHRHGADVGPRVPHCPTDKHKHYPDGYTLKHCGLADEDLLATVYGRGWKGIIAREVRDHRKHLKCTAARKVKV